MSEICTFRLIWHYGPEKESLLQINELSNIWMMIFSLWVLMLMLGDDVECVDKKMIYFYTFRIETLHFYLKHFIQSMVFFVVQNMVKGSL